MVLDELVILYTIAIEIHAFVLEESLYVSSLEVGVFMQKIHQLVVLELSLGQLLKKLNLPSF